MSRYLEILAVQRPFPYAQDENQRVMFSTNYEAVGESPVTQWEEDIVKILSSLGLSTLNVDTIIGFKKVLDGDGPFLNIIDTGGSSPLETHDEARYENLSCQIIVRAASFTLARTRAQAIYAALDGKRNITVL